MRKKQALAILLALWTLLAVSSAFAAVDVPRMDIQVHLEKDGSALITQTWYSHVTEGTELYLPMQYLGDRVVSDFTVSDSQRAYTYVSSWDSDKSMTEKAYTCGILEKSRGIELCWGISAYGDNVYTLSYRVTGVVTAYNDADGFNYRFVNADMDFFPTQGTITITAADGTPLTDSRCDIWSFGYDGQIVFQGSGIYAYTATALEDGANMTILVRFDKGLFTPSRTEDRSFEDVKAAAMDGSDYEDKLPVGALLGAVGGIAIAVGAIAAAAVVHEKKQKEMRERLENEAVYVNRVPSPDQLYGAYWLVRAFKFNKNTDAILQAMLLEMLRQGNIEMSADNSDPANQKLAVMRLISQPSWGGEPASQVYDYLASAAASGSDGALRVKSLKKYASKHGDKLNSALELAYTAGRDELIASGCFIGPAKAKEEALTTEGHARLVELLGVKKYLCELPDMDQPLNKEDIAAYMPFAVLLDVQEQAESALKQRYSDYYYGSPYSNWYLWSGWYYTSGHEGLSSYRSSGSGGSSSMGGGGGFSGGGSGGGAR